MFRKKNETQVNVTREEVTQYLKTLKRITAEMMIGADPFDDIDAPEPSDLIRHMEADKNLLPVALHLVGHLENAFKFELRHQGNAAEVEKAVLLVAKYLTMYKSAALAERGMEM